jgi:hypothetical protein
MMCDPVSDLEEHTTGSQSQHCDLNNRKAFLISESMVRGNDLLFKREAIL